MGERVYTIYDWNDPSWKNVYIILSHLKLYTRWPDMRKGYSCTLVQGNS